MREYREKSHIGRKADEFSFGHVVECVGREVLTEFLDIEALRLWRADASSHKDGAEWVNLRYILERKQDQLMD